MMPILEFVVGTALVVAQIAFVGTAASMERQRLAASASCPLVELGHLQREGELPVCLSKER